MGVAFCGGGFLVKKCNLLKAKKLVGGEKFTRKCERGAGIVACVGLWGGGGRSKKEEGGFGSARILFFR